MNLALDIAERGWLGDRLIRVGIRRLLHKRLQDIHQPAKVAAMGVMMALTGLIAVVLYLPQEIVRDPLVPDLVHGPDPGRIYRSAHGMVCHGNGSAAIQCIWCPAYLRFSLTGGRVQHRPVVTGLHFLKAFRWCYF